MQKVGDNSLAQTVAEMSDKRTQSGKDEQAQQDDAAKELIKVRKSPK